MKYLIIMSEISPHDRIFSPHGFSLTLQLLFSLISDQFTSLEWTCSVWSQSLGNSPSDLHCAGTARRPPEQYPHFISVIQWGIWEDLAVKKRTLKMLPIAQKLREPITSYLCHCFHDMCLAGCGLDMCLAGWGLTGSWRMGGSRSPRSSISGPRNDSIEGDLKKKNYSQQQHRRWLKEKNYPQRQHRGWLKSTFE